MPKVVGARDATALFRLCAEVQEARGDVVLDGTDVEFVDSLGIAVLGALLEPISVNRKISVLWLRPDPARYLDRMDVLSRCNIEGPDVNCATRNHLADRLVELTRIGHEHEADEAASRLATALVGQILKSPSVEADKLERFRHPLRYALSELLLNALSHAKREGRGPAAVWIAAQYYPGQKVAQFAVVDNGCGILATLQNSPLLATKTHAGAIEKALEPFVSCNPNLGLPGGTSNRGVGLTTTKRIAHAASGHLLITSGDGVMDTRSQSSRVMQSAYWQGTAISFFCKRSDLPAVNIPSLLPDLPPEDSPFALNFAP